jgi:hypothetical protein
VPSWQAVLVLVFWVLVAYLVLPRAHRILTGVYVPDYFIGRTRTADGLLGDPVNLALLGSAGQLHQALERAGWSRADDLTIATGWRIVTSTLSRRSYAEAPVSPLFLFRRTQDFAYQQEVAGSPSKRHHVRFWKCPDGWLLPGGFAVDWLAAGTYDRSVGLSLFTLQVTHKIEEDVDVERDHIVATVRAANPEVRVTVLPDFFTGYHSRNGGGDLIQTDGDLPILDLSALPADDSAAPVPATDHAIPVPVGSGTVQARTGAVPSLRRPSQTTFGVVVTGLRGLVYLGTAVLAFTGNWAILGAADPGEPVAAAIVGVVYLLAALLDVTLAAATFAGRNSARLALCALSAVSVASTFFGRAASNEHGPLHAGLLPLAVSVLVLLALSSEAASDWAALRSARPELTAPNGRAEGDRLS